MSAPTVRTYPTAEVSYPVVGYGTVDTTKRALCSHDDPELWFPDQVTRDLEAIGICEVCPIREACLEFALDHNMVFGIWGGKTEEQRAELMKNRPAFVPELGADEEPPSPKKTSEVNGVSWNRWRERWTVSVNIKGKRHYGGDHITQEAAEAKARAMHAKFKTSPVRQRGGRGAKKD